MIVLTLEPGEDAKLAEGAPGLQRKYGMPIDPNPYARTFSSEPACRAVVAARLNAPGAEAPLLRRLRVRAMLGGLLDDPALLAAAAADVGLDPEELERWIAMPAVEDALRADIEAARSPSRAARALDHKLGGPARRAPLHGAELRADLRRPHVLDPRLQPGRGLRDGDRQPRPRLPAARPSRSSSCWRGRPSRWRPSRWSRSCRPTRPRPAPRWPVPQPDPGRRRLLLERLVAPAALGP